MQKKSFKKPQTMDGLKYPKPDLVWYAAYDEDINSKLFIEKLLKLSENIE
jgi:hypothetical protein